MGYVEGYGAFNYTDMTGDGFWAMAIWFGGIAVIVLVAWIVLIIRDWRHK